MTDTQRILLISEIHADGTQTNRTWMITEEDAEWVAEELGEPQVENMMTGEQFAEMADATRKAEAGTWLVRGDAEDPS